MGMVGGGLMGRVDGWMDGGDVGEWRWGGRWRRCGGIRELVVVMDRVVGVRA